MSTESFSTRMRARLEEIREWCRRNGYADYIYTPYVPLQVTQVVLDEREEDKRDRLRTD